MTTTINLALAGCGTVGGALVELLHRHRSAIAIRHGLRLEITSVLVRDTSRARTSALDPALFTHSLDGFLRAPAHIVVEAIGGLHEAVHVARSSLLRSQRFVTANKTMLRVHGPELAALARAHRIGGASLDFEAAVGGGMPIVRLLRQSLCGHGLTRIRGVLNGTTNYILSRVERGRTFADALADAQKAGFAEADPARDLDGRDAADKLAVLAWLAFGVDPSSLDVHTVGIDAERASDAVAAAARGRALRLVATAHRVGNRVCARVTPRVIPRAHPFAQVRDEENLVQLESESAGTVTVSGRGAGGSATASALLADILRVSETLS